jgi:protein-disulfide isomerase
MKALMTCGAAAVALMLAGCDGGNESETAGNATAAATPAAMVPAPNGGNWTEVVSETEGGGFRVGNPDAKVKLVEFASLTCPHCADFSANGAPALLEKYVKTGQVSFELRNFVRDPVDLAAALLSRCGGATPYFKLTDQLFAAQEDWIGKLQALPPAEQQQLQSLPPAQVTGALADRAGLVQFMRVRGIPADKAEACLADEKAIQRLVDMNQAATRDFQVSGTPTFVINGRVVPNTADWTALEPRLREAIG